MRQWLMQTRPVETRPVQQLLVRLVVVLVLVLVLVLLLLQWDHLLSSARYQNRWVPRLQ
jgi:hypothetical protein